MEITIISKSHETKLVGMVLNMFIKNADNVGNELQQEALSPFAC